MMRSIVSSGPRTFAVCAALLALPVAVLMAQHLSASDPPAIELVVGPDPISTLEHSGMGGGFLTGESLDVIAGRSDALARVRVVDVQRSRLNTPDGTLRTAAMLVDRDERRPVPITTVQIEVLEVIGGSSDSRQLSAGSKTDLTIFGGIVDYRINDPDIVDHLEIMEVVNAPRGKKKHPDPVRGSPVLPPDGEEVERPAQVPVVISIGLSPSEELTEGDDVYMFLAESSLQSPNGQSSEILTPTHPYGILYPDDTTGELRDQRGSAVSKGRVEELGVNVGR